MIPVFALSAGGWVLLAVASLLLGVAKTALPGLATVAVAMFAAVLPARESTAVMLLLLLLGDVIAVWTYRHDVDWRGLRALIVPVLIGVVAGAGVLARISDGSMKRMIGVILLLLTAVTLVLMRRPPRADGSTWFSTSAPARWSYGAIGGFTTMVANAGGPPMTLYFMASGLDMMRFMGTQAWFFFVVNLTKVPFQAGLGLYSGRVFGTDLLLAVGVVVGTVLGRLLMRHMRPEVFNPLIIGLTVVSSAYLLV